MARPRTHRRKTAKSGRADSTRVRAITSRPFTHWGTMAQVPDRATTGDCLRLFLASLGAGRWLHDELDLLTIRHIGDLLSQAGFEAQILERIERDNFRRIKRAAGDERCSREKVQALRNRALGLDPILQHLQTQFLSWIGHYLCQPILEVGGKLFTLPGLGNEANDLLSVPGELIAEGVLGEEEQAFGEFAVFSDPPGRIVPCFQAVPAWLRAATKHMQTMAVRVEAVLPGQQLVKTRHGRSKAARHNPLGGLNIHKAFQKRKRVHWFALRGMSSSPRLSSQTDSANKHSTIPTVAAAETEHTTAEKARCER